MSTWYRWNGNDLLLQVQVQPRAHRDEVVGVVGERVKIRITAAPKDDEANAHLTALLARWFGTPKSQVQVVRGHKGKPKLLQITCPRQIPELLDISSLP